MIRMSFSVSYSGAEYHTISPSLQRNISKRRKNHFNPCKYFLNIIFTPSADYYSMKYSISKIVTLNYQL